MKTIYLLKICVHNICSTYILYFNCTTESNYSYSGKILLIKRQFRLQNVKYSKVDGNKLARLTVIIFPALENNLSLEADVAGIAKYFFAN